MEELSGKLHDKIKELAGGKLDIKELETLAEDARELYERLLIIKYKAYEKYGEPEKLAVKEIVVEEEPIEEKVEEVIVPEKEVVEEEAIDFSGITEEVVEEDEQPSFDFSAMEETKEEVAEEVVEEKVETPEIKKEPVALVEEQVAEKEEDDDSLNEQFKTTEDQSLRKQFQSSPISDIRKEISIAKKFEYITFMFAGKNDIYEAAIEDLNNCSDGEDAKNKLNDYSSKHSWDLENKSIIKFVELVERRYL
jgi:hypothetical protein